MESKSSEARSLERQVGCLSARHIDTNSLKEWPPGGHSFRSPGLGAEAWDSRKHAWNMWEPDTLNPCSDSDNVPVSLQVSELSETVARLHESISAGQGALAPAVDRVSALRTRLELELQQTQLHSQSPDSLAQCLGRLVSAHSVFVSNVEAPYLPLPPPMMPRVSAVTASRPEPKEWREASGITRSAPTGAAWSGLTEAAKSLVQAADGLQGGHQGGAAGGDGKDEAEGDLGGGKQLITAPAPVVYVARCPESNRTQVNARMETNVTQTGQEQGDGGESEVIARAVKTVEAAAAAKETYVDWEEKLQHLLDATAPRFSCLAHAAADS